MLRLKQFSCLSTAVVLMACGQSNATNSQSTPAESAPTSNNATLSEAVQAWTVMADQSSLTFTAQQQGTDFTGEFTEFDADIRFDPENLAGSSVVVNVPLAQTDAGDNDRNSTLPGKAWFSTKKFPTAIFTSNDISQTGEGEYLAKGSLTMKGIENPLDLPFSLTIGDTAEMTSEVILDRTEWNVGEDPWNTDEWVSTTVTLDIKVVAKKK